MKYSKYLIISILICSSLVNWVCDDRVPDDTQSGTKSTIDVIEAQAIADEGGDRVGEVVSGYSSMRIVATLKNESGQAFNNQTISFSHNGQGGDFSNGANAITDENGQVINVFKPNSSEQKVDATTTPDFEGLIVTLTYGTSPTVKVEFNVYQEKEDVWPYTLNVSSDVDNIKLDNGVTTAQITAKLFNKTNTPLHNVILLFNSNKGYIDGEGTTDSTGSVTMTFQDNGDQEDIGLANIVCSFEHPAFSATVSDSAQVTIGTDNGLTLQIFPVTYDETGNTAIVGEDISGSVSYTLLIATVTDTSGNVISGIPITFTATSSNVSVGSITYANVLSNTNGQVVAEFDDGGNVYTDNPGTPNYEGVSVVAYFGDKVTDPQTFNVYNEDDVWPYSLYLTKDTDVIQLDGGETYANLAARLLNKLGNPIDNAQIAYSATNGYINAIGYTDSTGVDSIIFTDLGDEEDLGVSDITATFIHPGYVDNPISDLLQIYIEDPSFQSCAYIEIPTSSPSHIVVREGGGTESTLIRASLYDDNDNLINTPTLVRFVLNPILDGCYLEEPAVFDTSIYTVNGIASVSVNSGTEPGPVRIEVSTDCDLDGNVDLEANAVPVTIVAGPPHFIYADWNPGGTIHPGGGIYQTQVSAIVKDRYHNPVEDSTYVYWTVAPVEPNLIVEAEIEGISLTFNEGEIDDASPIHGVAFTNLTYHPPAIGKLGRITVYTWGDDLNDDGIYGDSIGTVLDDGEAIFPFIPGLVELLTDKSYHDFSLPLPTDSVTITITAMVTGYYGNPVVNAPVAFIADGSSEFVEISGYPLTGFTVNTDEDGMALIGVRYHKPICSLSNEDDNGECTYDDFTSNISATLLVPVITTSQPLPISLVRSGKDCD